MTMLETSSNSSSQISSLKKWVIELGVLVSLSLLCFGSVYIFDVPQELAGEFMTRFSKNEADIEYLYALYSTPGIFMAFLGGFAVSFITPLISGLLCTYFIFMASVLIAFGVHQETYWMITSGRFVYGLFGEPLNIV